jgi:hypothetical protein
MVARRWSYECDAGVLHLLRQMERLGVVAAVDEQ